ncbi:MAG: hypothetical protein ACYST6_15940 [Planctomycetota bacterium]|jgi:hypothetical protein
MKRVLILVLAVQVVLLVGGCEKKADAPPGERVEGGAEPAAFSPPVAVEEEEAVEPDPSRGLAGWWKLDEDSGKTAADSSGNGRDGTLMGNVSFDNNSVEGQVDKALRLEGEGVQVQITGYKGVTGTAPRTVAAWIKTEHNDGPTSALCRGGAGSG